MYACIYYLRSIHCYVYINCLYHTNLMRFDALHGLLNLTTIRKQGLYYNKQYMQSISNKILNVKDANHSWYRWTTYINIQ
jgi:hypothetical protein